MKRGEPHHGENSDDHTRQLTAERKKRRLRRVPHFLSVRLQDFLRRDQSAL